MPLDDLAVLALVLGVVGAGVQFALGGGVGQALGLGDHVR